MTNRGEGREQPVWTAGGLGDPQATPGEPHPHRCKIKGQQSLFTKQSYALGTRSLTDRLHSKFGELNTNAEYR